MAAGRLASPLGAAGEGAGRFNIMAQPTPANLLRLAELLDAGALQVSLQRSYQLEQAGDALQALPTTHTQGKLGLTIAESSGAHAARAFEKQRTQMRAAVVGRRPRVSPCDLRDRTESSTKLWCLLGSR